MVSRPSHCMCTVLHTGFKPDCKAHVYNMVSASKLWTISWYPTSSAGTFLRRDILRSPSLQTKRRVCPTYILEWTLWIKGPEPAISAFHRISYEYFLQWPYLVLRFLNYALTAFHSQQHAWTMLCYPPCLSAPFMLTRHLKPEVSQKYFRFTSSPFRAISKVSHLWHLWKTACSCEPITFSQAGQENLLVARIRNLSQKAENSIPHNSDHSHTFWSWRLFRCCFCASAGSSATER